MAMSQPQATAAAPINHAPQEPIKRKEVGKRSHFCLAHYHSEERTGPSSTVYWHICGCPGGSRQEDERLTCPLHHVIFCRKCLHSSGTKHFVFNTEIDCIDCLGKSTLDQLAETETEIENAGTQVARYHDELCRQFRRGRMQRQDEDQADTVGGYVHLIKTQQKWKEERDRLLVGWPDRNAKIMREFNEDYGDWDKTYWEAKKKEDEANGAYPAVAWFVGDGDRDFLFERKAHETVYSPEEVTILERITGRSRIQ